MSCDVVVKACSYFDAELKHFYGFCVDGNGADERENKVTSGTA